MGLCASKTAPEHDAGLRAAVQLHSPSSAKVDQMRSYSTKDAATKQSAARQLQLRATAATPLLDAQQLPDEVLAAILSRLPLSCLLQLSASSRRVHELVGDGAALAHVDLRDLPWQRLGPAMAWLQAQPVTTSSLLDATLPVNHPGTAALLAAAQQLRRLQLYVARPPYGQVHTATADAPPPSELPLSALAQLTDADIELEYGALPKGASLQLPRCLTSLTLHGGSGFVSAVAALGDPAGLSSLSHLRLSALDTGAGGAAKSLASLVALPALRTLHLGRLWAVPRELAPLLDRLEAAELLLVQGRVTRAAMGGVEHPLSAAASGLDAASTAGARPRCRLSLSANVPVGGICDGLAPDWSTLGAALRRLCLFDVIPVPRAPPASAARGAPHTASFDLSALAALPHMSSLHITFLPPEIVAGVRVTLEMPGLDTIHSLHDLTVRCQGPGVELQLCAAGRLARLLVAAAGGIIITPPGSSASDILSRPPSETSSIMSRCSDSAAELHRLSWPISAISATMPAAASPAGSGAELGPLGGVAAGIVGNHPTKRGSLELPRCALDLHRLASIVEGEAAWDETDEAQQLSHIPCVGLLAGGSGVRVYDPEVAAAAAAVGRDRPGKRRDGRGSIMSVEAWMAVKGVNLQQMRLEQQSLALGPRGGKGAGGQQMHLLVRQGMRAEVMAAFRSWGVAC